MRKWWSLALVGFGGLVLAACDGGSGDAFRVDPSLNADKANPAAATRQQCIDAGHETGTVAYTQCITEGRGLPKD